jgi:hypothetical protein
MKKLLAIAIATFACVSAFAFESYEAYYIEQTIEAYQSVADAIESRRESVEGKDPRVMISNAMGNFIAQRNGMRKARNIFDQFKDSKNFAIKSSSALMAGNLMMLETQMDASIKQTEKLLNMSNAEFLKQAGTTMKELQETTETINDTWDIYVKSSATIPLALLEGMDKDPMLRDKDAMNKKMSKLVVSRKFVNDTKKVIYTRFKIAIEKYNKKEYNDRNLY